MNYQHRPETKLNEIDKDEAEILAFMVAPQGYTRDQFEKDWQEFCRLKRIKGLN